MQSNFSAKGFAENQTVPALMPRSSPTRDPKIGLKALNSILTAFPTMHKFARLLLAILTFAAVCRASPTSADIVVYSGTPGGIAAAVTAAREGAKVILIEPTRHVGGHATSGVNTAESNHLMTWTLGGFSAEFYRRLGRHYQTDEPAYFFESSVGEKIYLDLIREAGVTVRYGAGVARVVKSNGKITGLSLADGTEIVGRIFIDASYEGDLMARAGVANVVGRESRAEFGEEAAGIRFDKVSRRVRTVDERGGLLPGISGWVRDYREGDAHPMPMNYNFRLTVTKDPLLRLPFPAPQTYDAGRYAILAGWFRAKTARGESSKLKDVIGLLARRNGKFEMNNQQAAVISLGHFGGQAGWAEADFEGRGRIYRDHLEYTLGLLRFLATDPNVPANVQAEVKELGLHPGEFADNGHLPYQLYVREARRMRGAYVVTQRDVQDDRRKSDSIGMSSHFIDAHHVQRLALNENEFVNEGRIWRMGYAYQIPYRALTPLAAECTNLLVPVAASFTHVAYCTFRLESVWMVAGHAAGVAAAMASRENSSVQKISVVDLQKRLRTQNQVIDFIPGQPEKCEHLNGPPEF